MSDDNRIANVIFDHRTVLRRRDEVEHDRAIAIQDLMEENYFAPVDAPAGPYNLHLSIVENRLVFKVCDEWDTQCTVFKMSLSSFRSVIKDYFTVCDSYYEALKTANQQRVETIDMGRRGLHNEGSELLRARMQPYAEIDLDTARRIFTLICSLHYEMRSRD